MLIIIALGFIVPRWYAVFVPPDRGDEGKEKTTANVSSSMLDADGARSQEDGRISSEEDSKSDEKKAGDDRHDQIPR